MAMKGVQNVESIRVDNLDHVQISHGQVLTTVTVSDSQTPFRWEINSFSDLAFKKIVDLSFFTESCGNLEAHRVDCNTENRVFTLWWTELSKFLSGSWFVTSATFKDSDVIVETSRDDKVFWNSDIHVCDRTDRVAIWENLLDWKSENVLWNAELLEVDGIKFNSFDKIFSILEPSTWWAFFLNHRTEYK